MTTQQASQAPVTSVSKEVSTKSTTAARVTATSGPAASAAELRKSKRKKAGLITASETASNAPQSNTPPPQQNLEMQYDPSYATLEVDTTNNETAPEPQEPRITLQPIPLPSFFEESLDILPPSPSPNASINLSHPDMLAGPQREPMTSTPHTNANDNSPSRAPQTDHNQTLPQPKSLKERLAEAEERGNHPDGYAPNPRDPLDKYTKAKMPAIHYAHPTAIFDHLDVNTVDDWENLPKGKLLAQPFGRETQNIEKHPHLKALLFAAIVEITKSQDVSVVAPKPKPNSNRNPYSFLIYNVSEQQAHFLLERRVWSSTAITFSVSTFSPGCPNYLFSIKGLTTMNNKEVCNMVKEVWHNQDSALFLQKLCQNFPDHLKEQAVPTLHRFIESLKVEILENRLPGGSIAPHFNVYANGPLISDDRIWFQLRTYYATRTYALQTQDPGTTAVAPLKCTICHAADHPRGLCPFPILDGWNGPKRREPIETPGDYGRMGPTAVGKKQLGRMGMRN